VSRLCTFVVRAGEGVGRREVRFFLKGLMSCG